MNSYRRVKRDIRSTSIPYSRISVFGNEQKGTVLGYDSREVYQSLEDVPNRDIFILGTLFAPDTSPFEELGCLRERPFGREYGNAWSGHGGGYLDLEGFDCRQSGTIFAFASLHQKHEHADDKARR